MARSPPALGASAAVNAVVLLTILLNPYSTVYIYAVLPVPAALLGLLYIGGDMFGVLGVSTILQLVSMCEQESFSVLASMTGTSKRHCC